MILVTGATGNIGHKVVNILSAKGELIRAGVHNREKAHFENLKNVEVAVLDFNQPDTIKAALKNINKLVFITPFSDKQPEWGNTVIELAARVGIRQIVRHSVIGAATHPELTLQGNHREVEIQVENSGIPFSLIRPATYMDNFLNRHAQTIRSEGRIYMPMGDARVPYIAADDIARVESEAIVSGMFLEQGIEITGSESLSLFEVATILSSVLGSAITYVDTSNEPPKPGNMPGWMVKVMQESNEARKKGWFNEINDNVEMITGQKPMLFREWARKYADKFLQQPEMANFASMDGRAQ
jgi:uncharacterized protein YbjT (DUF2867 family)